MPTVRAVAVTVGAVVATLAVTVGAVVATLAVLGVAAAVARGRGATFAGSRGLIALFHLDGEFNLPAIVSVLGLAACGVLLLLVASVSRTLGDRDATRWRWLGIGFLYLALDEGARIHERANAIVNEWGPSLAALRFGWVVLGMIAVVALTPVYLPAVWRLAPDLRLLAVASAVVYVGGAIGMELVGSLLYDRGTDDALYQGGVVVEETAELSGIALFLTTLWAWWRRIAPRTVLAHAP